MSSKIGAWYLAGFESRPNEAVIWSCLANRKQSSWRAVGGKLFVTNQRILFCPHLLDSALGGHKWSVSLDEIEMINDEIFSFRLFCSDLPTQMLAMSVRDGNKELFVVKQLKQVIQRLRTAIV